MTIEENIEIADLVNMWRNMQALQKSVIIAAEQVHNIAIQIKNHPLYKDLASIEDVTMCDDVILVCKNFIDNTN